MCNGRGNHPSWTLPYGFLVLIISYLLSNPTATFHREINSLRQAMAYNLGHLQFKVCS